MSKLRSVSTAFWSDPFIEDLTPDQKLLFLYLITNEKTNMLGIYEASIKKICFETGLKKETASNGLKEFERLGKVKYINNYVILVNYLKHQNFNTNMKKSAIDVYNGLPTELMDRNLSVSKDNPLEGFETLLNHFGMVRKVEVEDEVKTEDELEVKVETKKETTAPIKKSGSLYSEFNKIYFEWFNSSFGIDPKFGAMEGKKMKSIIKYLEKETKEGMLPADSWSAILNNWDQLSDFYQGQTKLSQIDSNLQNIIVELKKKNDEQTSKGKSRYR